MSSIIQSAFKQLLNRQKHSHCEEKYKHIDCKYFNTRKGCFRGESCWYNHDKSIKNNKNMQTYMDILKFILTKLEEVISIKPILNELIDQINDEKYNKEQQRLVQECLNIKEQEEKVELEFSNPININYPNQNKSLKFEDKELKEELLNNDLKNQTIENNNNE